MAKNLRAKIPAEDTLLVHDRDEKAVAQFVKEIGIAAAGTGRSDKGMGIEVISSPREVAERSVSSQLSHPISPSPGQSHQMMIDYSQTHDLSREVPFST